MDLEKHLIEAKTLALEEQQLKEEISAHKLELAIEEQSLDLLLAQDSRASDEIDSLVKLCDFKRAQLETIQNERNRLNKTDLQKTLLKTCLNKMAPTAEFQVERFKGLKAEYEKLLGLYEQQPLYQQILQETTKQRALEERIQELKESMAKE